MVILIMELIKIEDEIRFTLESLKMTKRERFRYWIRRMRAAAFDPVPTERTSFKGLNPGDEGYEKAPFVSVISQIRHDLK